VEKEEEVALEAGTVCVCRRIQGSSCRQPHPGRQGFPRNETQWDTFASITDLEIRPLGDPEDDDYDYDYEHFQVVDVFVRCGGSDSDSDSDSNSNNSNDNDNDKTETGWFRIGKVCTSEDTPLSASLSLQKGLILWTAVHMRRELLAKGKAGARALELELGFIDRSSRRLA